MYYVGFINFIWRREQARGTGHTRGRRWGLRGTRAPSCAPRRWGPRARFPRTHVLGCVLVAFCLRSAPFLRSRVLDFAFCPLAFCPCVLGGPCVLGLAFWAPCVLCLLDLAFWVAWRSGSCVLGCLAFCLRSALAFWGLAFCLRSRVLPCVLLAFSRSACVLLFCLRSGVLPCWCGRWSSDGRASTIRGCNF